MADRDGPAFALCVGDGPIELRDDRGLRGRVVQELRIAESGADAVFLGGVVGDRFLRGAAIHEKKPAVLERLHQRVHQRRIGSGARALMIIHARGMRNSLQHRA